MCLFLRAAGRSRSRRVHPAAGPPLFYTFILFHGILDTIVCHTRASGILTPFPWINKRLPGGSPSPHVQTNPCMLRHHLIVMLRHIRRHKSHALANILSLVIGLTCSTMIVLYIQDEWNYDRYHEKADRIVRIVQETNARTPPALGPAFQEAFPEVLAFVRLRPPNGIWVMRWGDKVFYEQRVFWADERLFEVFSWTLLAGDPQTALRAPFSVVLSQTAAARYFGKTDPVGQILRADDLLNLTVTGIMKDIPASSHVQADFFISLSTLSHSMFGEDLRSWHQSVFYYTYVLLHEPRQAGTLADKLPGFVERQAPGGTAATLEELSIQPLTDIHLSSHLAHELSANRDIRHLYILGTLGVLILIIACINFMNSATARSVRRAKEVGIRKVVGAVRGQLIRQFMGESLFLALAAWLIAVGMVPLLLPLFNVLSEKTLTVEHLLNPRFILTSLGMMWTVGFLSGSYPALYLSAFQPVRVLKGILRESSKSHLRKGLVGIQFTLSILLLICTGILYEQLTYMRHKRLGMEPDQVILLPGGQGRVNEQYDALKSALLRHPRITGVTIASTMPGRSGGAGMDRTMALRTSEGPDHEAIDLLHLPVHYDFIRTLGITLIAGRDFSRDFATDFDRAVMLNETGVRQLGWSSPEAAVGQTLLDANNGQFTVIGVVNDFHLRSLHHRIQPLVMDLSTNIFWVKHPAVRIQPGNMAQPLDYIRTQWQIVLPGLPFNYSFLNEDFNQLYQQEEQLGRVFAVCDGGGFHRLSGALRSDRFCYRATDQGDRHSQSAGRVYPEHAVSSLQRDRYASASGQPDRRADGLFCHEQVAPELRLSYRDGCGHLSAGRGARPGYSASNSGRPNAQSRSRQPGACSTV